MRNEILRQKAIEAVVEIYRQVLLEKAIAAIQSSFPNTDHFILVGKISQDVFDVGYMSYYTEEAVLTDYSESIGLTEDDIGKPCEYWVSTMAIDDDGSVYECYSGNANPDDHPNWEQILENDRRQMDQR